MMGSANGMGCVCTVITLTFDNDRKVSLKRVMYEGEGKFEDCYYRMSYSGLIGEDVSVGILFSQLAEERGNMDAVRKLIQEYVDPSAMELLEDATAITYGEMNVQACVSKEYGDMADPFNMLGIDAPRGFDINAGVLEADGITGYYDDTLETLNEMRDGDSKGFLFFFSENEDICVETSEGSNYSAPSLKLEDLGNLLGAEYRINLYLDTIDERKRNIMEWAEQNSLDIELSEDMEPGEFFGKLGLNGVVDEEDDVFRMKGNIDCTKIPYSFLDLIMALQKGQDYWLNEVICRFEKQSSIYIDFIDGGLYLSRLE